jgi:hypothetical protein
MRSVLASLCCLALLAAAGCATGGGVAVEGRASQVTPPPTPPTPPTLPSGTPASADAVGVLRADPAVDAKVKVTLVPCVGGYYPIDDRYVDLTGDGEAELVVTLLNCPEAREAKGMSAYTLGPGYAGYAYDLATDPPTRLLGVEGGGVDLVPYTGAGNDLALIRSSYEARDDPCCPSGQTFTLYRWNGAALVEVPR